jgi:hypothetical protein
MFIDSFRYIPKNSIAGPTQNGSKALRQDLNIWNYYSKTKRKTQDRGTGNDFLNKSPIAQEITRMNKGNCIK